MKRAFYRNALHAAVMAQDFGLRFLRADLLNWQEKLLKANNLEQARHNGCYYVHPDSMKLLEPMEDDLLLIGDDLLLWVCPDSINGISEEVMQRFIRISAAKCYIEDGEAEIILRGGNRFYYPEWEE